MARSRPGRPCRAPPPPDTGIEGRGPAAGSNKVSADTLWDCGNTTVATAEGVSVRKTSSVTSGGPQSTAPESRHRSAPARLMFARRATTAGRTPAPPFCPTSPCPPSRARAKIKNDKSKPRRIKNNHADIATDV